MMSNHPFERAGLGKAPFTFMHCTHEIGPIRIANDDGTVTEIGSPGQPMGVCDYCGQGIATVCHVRSADGNRFRVGCDCVLKTDKEYGDKQSPLTRAVKKQQREAAKQREIKRIANAAALLTGESDVAHRLESMPHPTEWRAKKGETALDSAIWMFQHAGHSGKLRMARMIEKVANQ